MTKQKHFQFSLRLITILMFLLIAGIATVSMFILRTVHYRQAHSSAMLNVFNTGKLITTYMADQYDSNSIEENEEDWSKFSKLVQSIYTIENGLQYVSIVKNGIVVFHEQTKTIDRSISDNKILPEKNNRYIKLWRKQLSIGTDTIPVVTFSTDLITSNGETITIEVALKKDTIKREEVSSTTNIISMFKVSLITIIISFGTCILLVIWMMNRESLRERQRREEEHLAFAGVMANGIVHDFRNPMSSLKLDVQMLRKESHKKESNSKRLIDLSEHAQDTIDRMDKIFQEFFYLSKPTEKKSDKISISEAVSECINTLEPRFKQAEIDIQTDTPSSGPYVFIPPISLKRALMNILTNAIQFSERGKPITVKTYTSKDMAIVEILDNGPGIPDSEKKRIFEMFVSTRPGGAGLGLFLAKTAIERHGGTIKAIDNPMGGIYFKIKLPLFKKDSS